MKLAYLDWKKTIKRADLQTEIQSMIKATDESYDLIRGMLAVLQSGSDSTDLFRLFSRYGEQIEARSAFKVAFAVQGEAKSLSAKRMRQLFYIFREALNNIEKHAEATLVDIKIHWNSDHLVFTVSDNGKGFDVSNVQYGSHFGLKFMHDRVELLNGSMEILSEINVGTHIVIQVPYEYI
jgi:two-component system sensor histidine kinase DegS